MSLCVGSTFDLMGRLAVETKDFLTTAIDGSTVPARAEAARSGGAEGVIARRTGG